MHFLISNDDGIRSENLHLLTEMTKAFGTVTVVAPETQCSAMSQHITVKGDLTVRRVTDFPVPDVKAYSVNGTPADCVKIALRYLSDEKPDFVFSGINMGINVGYDICYSGTVAAATEAVMEGFPAIAWSTQADGSMDTTRHFFPGLLQELTAQSPPQGCLWNVNFPGIAHTACKGILRDRIPACVPHYADDYSKSDLADGSFVLSTFPRMNFEAPPGTDLRAVTDGYVSVGYLFHPVLCYERADFGKEK